MRTDLSIALLATDQGQRADAILRSCVHCGFCNATCPTYQILGDELDGPRGRIYLIKELLESVDRADNAWDGTVANGSSDSTQAERAARTERHLDRCLTCRACETTCPSGVAYGELLEIGRAVTAEVRPRSLWQRLLRDWLTTQMASARRVRRWSLLGRTFAPLLPARLRHSLPPKARHWTAAQGGDGTPVADPALNGLRVLLLDGCVQEAATPATNQRLQALLQRRGAQVVRLPRESCCGALALHLGAEQRALTAMRSLLDQFETVASEVDYVVSTASGCGVTQRDYARLFAAEGSRYAQLARLFCEKLCDASELLCRSESLRATQPGLRVAWHAPCSLQHGQRLQGGVERVLQRAGYELVSVQDSHLCCGSAGTYSLLQSALSQELAVRKLQALTASKPALIATANVGCQLHLQQGAAVPVKHWLELLQ